MPPSGMHTQVQVCVARFKRWLPAPRQQLVPRCRYVRGDSYKATQAAFEHVQASFDPNALVALMQRSPYHTDTLMAMYDLYRHTGGGRRLGCRCLSKQSNCVLVYACHGCRSTRRAACHLAALA